jgi:hypothetical protein
MLRPFWRYFGAKWLLAPYYPTPAFGTIVEPFAGAAGYALRYADRRVILVEKNPIIAGIWRYLISAPPDEILRIPTVDCVDELPVAVPQEARWLVGMCMNAGVTSPRRQISSGMRKFRDEGGKRMEGWSPAKRLRVAEQVGHIKHWQIIEGDYTRAPSIAATWFVDAPYQGAGDAYPCGSRDLNYAELASWCRRRAGQAIVCEAAGAAWLPFRPLGASANGIGGRRSAEALWTNGVAAAPRTLNA